MKKLKGHQKDNNLSFFFKLTDDLFPTFVFFSLVFFFLFCLPSSILVSWILEYLSLSLVTFLHGFHAVLIFFFVVLFDPTISFYALIKVDFIFSQAESAFAVFLWDFFDTLLLFSCPFPLRYDSCAHQLLLTFKKLQTHSAVIYQNTIHIILIVGCEISKSKMQHMFSWIQTKSLNLASFPIFGMKFHNIISVYCVERLFVGVSSFLKKLGRCQLLPVLLQVHFIIEIISSHHNNTYINTMVLIYKHPL